LKKTLILALVAAATSSFSQVYYDQSQLINGTNAGTGAIAGQHISMLEAGETIFGFGAQTASNNICADDFTVGSGGAVITGFSIFMYTTGATAPNLTGVSWNIGSAPSTSLTATAVTSTFWSVGGANVYRVNAGDTGSTGGLREIQIATVTGLNLNLSPGTYFLSFNAAPGNFTPPLPTSLASHGQNMQQSLAGGAFAPVVTGSTGADMAFIIHGQPVPEPGTIAVVGLGALALLRRRKKA
jgi:hypothetical protein